MTDIGMPVFLVENLFSDVQFSNHTISAEEEPSNNEAFRVATGRRSAQNMWTSSTANSDTWIKTVCDRVRGADMIAIDRGHNLAGYEILLQGSNDSFTTSEDIFDITMPAVTAPGSIDDTLGVLTEEGAWLRRFSPVRSYESFRLYVPAMGAGLKPQIRGLYVGKSLSPRPYDFPTYDEPFEPMMEVIESEAGWRGVNALTIRRQGTIGLRMRSVIEYDQARYHLVGHFARNRPMWVVFDQYQADRSILVVQNGGFAFGFDGAWLYRRALNIPWVEHEPQRD